MEETARTCALADPVQVDAELAVLGSVLLNEHALEAVLSEGLKPRHFGSWRHQALFGAVLVLRHAGRPVDPITINDHLDTEGILDGVDRSYVHSLFDLPFIATRAREYARIILRRHRERERIRIGEELSAGEIDESAARRRLEELGGDGHG